jgi:hypothetical protein
MQLIMENWRQYKQKVNNDHKFKMILENINNSSEESDIDSIIEAWLLEEEQLLNEIDVGGAIKKGIDYLNTKVNDFLIKLYLRATDIISNLFSAGSKFLKPALKIIKFISQKVGGFFQKHPLIARMATLTLVALVLLCASAIMNQAMAAEADPSLDSYADLLQGILADRLANIEGLADMDILSTDADPKIKAQIASAINHLESMKGNITDLSDFEKVQAKGGEEIAKALKHVKELVRNPPEGVDERGIKAAISIWSEAGEKIEAVNYEYISKKSAFGSSSSERLSFQTTKEGKQ